MMKSIRLFAATALALVAFAAHAQTSAVSPTTTAPPALSAPAVEAAPAPEGKVRMPRAFREAREGQEAGKPGLGQRMFELHKQIDQNVEKLASAEVQKDKAATARLKDETIAQLLELRQMRQEAREQMATHRARGGELGDARVKSKVLGVPPAQDAPRPAP